MGLGSTGHPARRLKRAVTTCVCFSWTHSKASYILYIILFRCPLSHDRIQCHSGDLQDHSIDFLSPHPVFPLVLSLQRSRGLSHIHKPQSSLVCLLGWSPLLCYVSIFYLSPLQDVLCCPVIARGLDLPHDTLRKSWEENREHFTHHPIPRANS